ncbi:MAG TPA: STAS domain-containing protein [Solirubrobacterales bacterium]
MTAGCCTSQKPGSSSSPKLKSSTERVILVLNFDLQIETEGSSALVRIRGDLDLQVIDQVTDAMARIESDAPELLVIDLSRLSFMDSSGMGVIAAASMRAADAGRRFAIVIPPAGVRQAFERTKLNEVITTTDDLANVYP